MLNYVVDCEATPDELSLNIHAAWLVSCFTTEGEPEKCTERDKTDKSLSVYTKVYESGAEGYEVVANEAGGSFPEISSVDADNFSAMIFALSALGQTIPYLDETQASKYPAAMHGVPYQICAAPQSLASTLCQEGAKPGDWLMDSNFDGNYYYMDPKGDHFEEVTTRPEDYPYNQSEKMAYKTQEGSSDLPDAISDYAGYLIPTAYFIDMYSLKEGENAIKLTLHLKNSITFRQPLPDREECLSLIHI